jgi:hypothetical protein
LRNGSSRTTTTDRTTMDIADIARHLSLEPHDDDFDDDLTPAERFSRAQLRAEYEAWRSDNPFSDILDWSLHLLKSSRVLEVAA